MNWGYYKKGMDWIGLIIWMNVLWLALSLAIITFVPSTFAMFSILLKCKKGMDHHEVNASLFWREFTKYLKVWKVYIFSAIILVFGAILYVDYKIITMYHSPFLLVLGYALVTFFILYFMASLYAIPILVHYNYSIPKTFMLSVLSIIRQPVKSIIMMVCILAIALLLLYFTGFAIMIFGALIAYTICSIINPLLN
ncbi:putative membrane protein YesL [Scopulibacillus darangshiensis]|uniref:Putative membrane protein YesL n=1 Tax=Scopulibacillus darangshiensis TaxID=442528 RepID=A0A4R2P3W5_9BACL|nr:DUF624 domain-containing protein [Scopulibacillus darangshiensis]TCP29470.1 putative membrane protein YesL [Scopulibacillus darangshiensis]